MPSHQRWNIDVERDLDGTTISTSYRGLTADEAMARRFEEEGLPGTIVTYEKTKYVHGPHNAMPDASEVFDRLRQIYSNDLERYPWV